MEIPAGQIPAFSPDGDLGFIPREQAPIAESQGYRIATPQDLAQYQKEQEFGTPGQIAATAAEGIAQGIAGPLAPMAETGLGITTPERMRARQEVNPGTHIAGLIGGTVAGAAIPGVGEYTLPGLAMKAGAAARGAVGTGTALARIGGAALAGAAEVNVFQTSDDFTRLALGDNAALTGEKLLAAHGISTILGAGMGGIPKAIAEALGAGGRKLEAMGVAGIKERAAVDLAKEQASATGKLGSATANAYRQMERAQFVADHPQLFDAEGVEAAKSLLSSPEMAELAAQNVESVLKNAPEAMAEMKGAQGAYAEAYGNPEQALANKTQELIEGAGERAGQRIGKDVVQRYAGRALFGSIAGQAAGLGGPLGALLGLNYAPMKEVIKRIAKDPQIQLYMGKFLQNPLQTLSTTATLGRLVGQVDSQATAAISTIFQGSGAAAAAKAAGTIVNPGNYTKIASEFNQLANDPDSLSTKLAQAVEPYSDHAPSIVSQLQASMTRAIQAVDQAAPKGQQTAPLDPPYRPSTADLQKFSQKLEVGNNPISLLHHVANGTLTPDLLAVGHLVYPSLMQEWQARLMDGLATAKAKGVELPHRTRLMLSAFLGSDLSSDMKPQATMMNQQAFAMRNAQIAAKAQAQQSKRNEMSASNMMSTPQQAATNRRMNG